MIRRISAATIRKKISTGLLAITQAQCYGQDQDSIEKKLDDMIEAFPQYSEAAMLGALCASPRKVDMETLRSGREINDEILRAVLVIELLAMPEPRARL